VHPLPKWGRENWWHVLVLMFLFTLPRVSLAVGLVDTPVTLWDNSSATGAPTDPVGRSVAGWKHPFEVSVQPHLRNPSAGNSGSPNRAGDVRISLSYSPQEANTLQCVKLKQKISGNLCCNDVITGNNERVHHGAHLRVAPQASWYESPFKFHNKVYIRIQQFPCIFLNIYTIYDIYGDQWLCRSSRRQPFTRDLSPTASTGEAMLDLRQPAADSRKIVVLEEIEKRKENVTGTKEIIESIFTKGVNFPCYLDDKSTKPEAQCVTIITNTYVCVVMITESQPLTDPDTSQVAPTPRPPKRAHPAKKQPPAKAAAPQSGAVTSDPSQVLETQPQDDTMGAGNSDEVHTDQEDEGEPDQPAGPAEPPTWEAIVKEKNLGKEDRCHWAKVTANSPDWESVGLSPSSFNDDDVITTAISFTTLTAERGESKRQRAAASRLLTALLTAPEERKAMLASPFSPLEP